jgi:hypothetical protein
MLLHIVFETVKGESDNPVFYYTIHVWMMLFVSSFLRERFIIAFHNGNALMDPAPYVHKSGSCNRWNVRSASRDRL